MSHKFRYTENFPLRISLVNACKTVELICSFLLICSDLLNKFLIFFVQDFTKKLVRGEFVERDQFSQCKDLSI